jgi:outer membrane protein OmpA-like peptidoglycan-associated protein
MAFNLNKNDGSQQLDPAHKTKFDLSKNDTPAKRNPYWILILLVLMIGSAAWYFTAGKKDVSASIQPDPVDSTKSAITETPDSPALQTNTDSSSVNRIVNNQIAASFDKGSVSAATISDSLVNSILSSNANIINVNGYASSEGDLALNMEISQRRADSFKKLLVSKGVDENKIIATGKGIESPIASNNTEVGRQKNRRVEVVIQ